MNRHLTPAMHRFLRAIRDSEDEYAIQEGLAVWVDLKRFHPSTVLKCLTLCLIKEDSYSDHRTHIWVLNSEGRQIIDDDNYEPLVLAEWRKRLKIVKS